MTHSIALALGAGGARGLAHIHAIRAFDELGIKPKIIAGTSMGSIIGAAACSGMTADAITDHILGKISNPLSLVNDAFKTRATSLKRFLAEGGPRIGELNLERILDVILPDAVPESFADLTTPLKIAATDFYGARTAVFEDGPLRSAMAASSAMPAVFLPVKRDGRFHIDGSATNPCPLNILQGSADHVIAIDVSGGTDGDPSERPSKLDAMYGANQMMQMSIVQNAAMQYPQTVLLRPPVASYRALDLLKAEEILTKTAALCEKVKYEIDRLCA